MRMSRRRRRKGILALRIVLLVLGLVLIGIPFLWIVLTAFKEPVDADASPPMFISPLTLSNFRAPARRLHGNAWLSGSVGHGVEVVSGNGPSRRSVR